MSTPEDVKPTYLVGYGSSEGDSKDYDTYYKHMKDTMKIPKTEITTPNSCCSVSGSRAEMLIPKTEASSCRSPSSTMRSTYDSYLNQDSNSSSMSSAENITTRVPPNQLHHTVLPQHAQQSYGMDDGRQNQLTHRSPYHQSPMSEEMYPRTDMRPYADMADPMSSGIARPVVTYSSDMNRSYESSLSNSNHRPYDPGTATAFERYESSGTQCGPLQQSLMPPRVPPQGIYGYAIDEQEQRYQQEAVQQHQLAVANANAVGMMKTEADQESTGPLYPR